jgi:hypothetical protein
MLVALQLVGDADTPLNVTVLDPCVAPKLVPVIVIELPIAPLGGERLVMPGATAKVSPLLVTLDTVSTT